VNEITARRTTGVSRRHGPVVEELGFASRYHGPETSTEPAVAAAPPRPHGDLSAAPVSLLAQLARDTWAGDSCTVLQRAQAVRDVLQYLLGFPGSTWQQRWEASPLGLGEVTASSLGSRRTTGASVSPGLRSLFCLRAIRPSSLALRLSSFQNYSEFFAQAQHDPLLDKFIEHASSFDAPWPARRDAAHELCCLLTVQGIALSDVTPGALLHHAHETRRTKASMPNVGKSGANRFAGRSTWDVLHSMGMFPPGTPLTMRAALTRGQRPVEELVGQYPIRDQAVRQLLIDYFLRRAADLDYASLKTLVLTLAHHFWEKIETVSPGKPTCGSPLRPTRHGGTPSASKTTAGNAASRTRSCLSSAASTTTCTPGRPTSLRYGRSGSLPARSRRASSEASPPAAGASTSAPPSGPASVSRCCPCSSSTWKTATTTPARCWSEPEEPPKGGIHRGRHYLPADRHRQRPQARPP
jgi:hypothetical protein